MNIAGLFPHHPRSATGNDPDAGSIPVLQLRAFLGRQWRLIAAITLLSIVLGIAFLVFSPNKYTARTDMIIDSKNTVWIKSEMSSETRGLDDPAVESEIETTKSEKVGKAVIRRLHLDKDPEFVGSGPGVGERIFSLFKSAWSKSGASRLALFKWADQPEEPPSDDELMRSAIGTLGGNLRVVRLGRSYHAEIAYTSLDPVKAEH